MVNLLKIVYRLLVLRSFLDLWSLGERGSEGG